MRFFQLFPLVVPYRSVLAASLSYTPVTVTAETYTPLIVISITLFLLLVFLAIKLVYIKHRRAWTIHGPPATVHSKPTGSHLAASTSRVGSRDKRANRGRGLLIGCLGSPTWETDLTSKLGGATWRRDQVRRASFAYRSTSKTWGSSTRLSKSTGVTSYASDGDQPVLPLSSESLRIPPSRGGKALSSVRRNTSTGCHPRYGDFGEFHEARSPGGGAPNITRRASPCSIRLVDGPGHSSQVGYSFLSALPPDAVVVSPLMGIRDSFQISRCSLKCDRKPVPPLPSMPLFLPFYLPNVPETLKSSRPLEGEYLPPLRFSPLTSAAKEFCSQRQVFEKKAPSNRVPDISESTSRVPCLESASSSKTHHATNVASPFVAQRVPTLHPARMTSARSNHKRSQSCTGLAIGGSSLRTTLEAAALSVEDKKWGGEMASMRAGILRAPSGSSRDGSVIPTKPLKSCLRQSTAVPMLVRNPDSTLTPSVSETSTRTFGTGDQASLLTPISNVEMGVLRLDQSAIPHKGQCCLGTSLGV
ncbi:hypothetical protein HD554DRAFT_2170127 [Boletus coccyginus]|nr:hypothetical protein HD554DRAFT_2170127 [Boletus coccyginus]